MNKTKSNLGGMPRWSEGPISPFSLMIDILVENWPGPKPRLRLGQKNYVSLVTLANLVSLYLW
uniref:Uncharacterized protein n=1 Tax=Arundo donax TaxID=35708 RepID=A0A0A8YTG3_ARUDO